MINVSIQTVYIYIYIYYIGVQCSAEVSLLFTGELNPVATKAQKKVPVPEG